MFSKILCNTVTSENFSVFCIYFMRVRVLAACICATHARLVPTEARGRQQTTGVRSCHGTVYVLGTKAESSASTPIGRAAPQPV